MNEPRILVLLSPGLYGELFAPENDRALCELGKVTFPCKEAPLTPARLTGIVPDADIIVTGRETPPFNDEVLEAAKRLRLIAHSAGSIKSLLPSSVFDRGITVTHAAKAIAPAVAEMTLMLIMLSLRPLHRFDRDMKSGEDWQVTNPAGMGQELAGQRVGVVGAGYTGRSVISILRRLDVEVLVYDPYLTSDQAAELGAQLAGLDELLSTCRIVTMQAPPTPETYRMIGARELALLQDNAIFINTARPHLVDSDALLAELKSGRIRGALDVFDQEPLPPNSPFLSLENVIATPHIAGASQQTRLRQGQIMVEEIKRFLTDEPLNYQITGDRLARMA